MIPTARFRPDRSRFDPESSNAILNAVPTADGWGPFKDHSGTYPPLPSACLGAASVRDSGGNYTTFAATRTAAYRLNDSVSPAVWVDITGSGGPYAVPDGDYWSGTIFGTRLIITNITDGAQFIDVNTGGTLEPLPNAPKAKFVWVAGGYVVFGYLSGTGNEKRLQWSGLENSEFYQPGRRGSDFQDMPDGGDVASGIGDEQGAYVFQRDRVRRMQLSVGSGRTFDFQDTDTGKGCIAPYGLINISAGDFIFLGESGFYRGPQSTPIGAEIVDRWFLDTQIDLDYLPEVQGALDPFNKIAWWTYRSGGATNRMIGYDWQLEEWCQSDADMGLLASLTTSATSLDSLPDTPSLDDEPPPYPSLDSRTWEGGRPTFAGFKRTDHTLGFFEGQPRNARLETNEAALFPGFRAFVNGFRPMTDAPEVTGDVAVKGTESDPLTVSGVLLKNRGGLLPCRADGRFHKFGLNITGQWTICHGVEPIANRAGTS